MSVFRLCDFGATFDYRLSIGQKKSGSPQILGWVALGFARFLVDFGSILGGFQAVRASAQDLGGFWASAQGLYIAASAAFPAWVGTYTTNNKSGLQSRKTAAAGGHKKKTAPEEYPGAIAKEKPPTVRPSTAFIFTLSFSGSRTRSRAAKPTHTKQPIFYTSLNGFDIILIVTQRSIYCMISRYVSRSENFVDAVIT